MRAHIQVHLNLILSSFMYKNIFSSLSDNRESEPREKRGGERERVESLC